ncbi:hypothetical protein AUP68_04573 [Ilyonectria robusta]
MSSQVIHELDELRTPGSLTEQRPTEQDEDQASIDALPPTDRGRGAYIALACCTVAQAPIWGMSATYLD